MLALKALARRPWPAEDYPQRQEFAKCWYEPLSDQKEVELALRFTLSEPITAAIPPGEEKLFWLAVDIAMNFKPIRPEERKKIEAWGSKANPIFKYKQQDKP